jgi:hypothetical protein
MKIITFKGPVSEYPDIDLKWSNCVHSTAAKMYEKELFLFDGGTRNDQLAGGMDTICLFVNEGQLIPFAQKAEDVHIKFGTGPNTTTLYNILIGLLTEEGIYSAFEYANDQDA